MNHVLERLHGEHRELWEKIGRARIAVSGGVRLSPEAHALLGEQIDHMDAYAETLRARIALMVKEQHQ